MLFYIYSLTYNLYIFSSFIDILSRVSDYTKVMKNFILTWNDVLYVCDMIIILFLVQWLTLYLFGFVCCFLSIWIIVAGMVVAVLQGVMSLYEVNLLIIYLCRYTCSFFVWIIVACMFFAVSTSVFFVCKGNDYYLISSSVIESSP